MERPATFSGVFPSVSLVIGVGVPAEPGVCGVGTGDIGEIEFGVGVLIFAVSVAEISSDITVPPEIITTLDVDAILYFLRKYVVIS